MSTDPNTFKVTLVGVTEAGLDTLEEVFEVDSYEKEETAQPEEPVGPRPGESVMAYLFRKVKPGQAKPKPSGPVKGPNWVPPRTKVIEHPSGVRIVQHIAGYNPAAPFEPTFTKRTTLREFEDVYGAPLGKQPQGGGFRFPDLQHHGVWNVKLWKRGELVDETSFGNFGSVLTSGKKGEGGSLRLTDEFENHFRITFTFPEDGSVMFKNAAAGQEGKLVRAIFTPYNA